MKGDESYGVGMVVSRIVNGKRVNLNKIKAKDQTRMDIVVEMSNCHARLIDEQDWTGLQELADEYEKLGAIATANRIRLERIRPSNNHHPK